MNNNENVLAGYCFLAALTENQNDLFNHVYVPICKRALSLYSLSGSTHGKATDIKEIIRVEYGIDVPQIMVKKLINSTFKSLSSRAKKKYNFTIFQNGELFEIQKYAFNDLEIQYKKGIRNAKALQEAFLAYLVSENIDPANIPAFSEFLDKNKKQLASFFKNTEGINGSNIETTFIHHVHFLEYIETVNHELFEIASGLYIGSIVASFLESGIDLEPKFESNEVYFLDTPIVLRALDLQKEEDTEPIKELLELVRNNGGKLKILSITIEEIHSVIENAIGNYNNTTPTSTINEACLRLQKNKAWLITYNGNLEKNILTSLKIEKEDLQYSFIEKHQQSPDVKSLQSDRIRKGNALHDVLAYLYVRHLRGSSISLFQKAKCWFLSTNIRLLKFNKENNPNNGITEIVLPDALTGLLWLKSPNNLSDKVKKIGLSELMASTLNEEIASKELINEFETNIRNLQGISEEDYRTLLESVAHQSARRIEKFNELVYSDNEKAKIEAHRIVEIERSKRAKRTKTIKDAQTSKLEEETKNRELKDKLALIEAELSDARILTNQSETKIEFLSKKFEAQRRINIIIFSLVLLFILSPFIYFTIKLYSILTITAKILNLILSGSGLWSLGSFIINFIKLSKGK